MIMFDEIKYWLYYLKLDNEDTELYAYTDNKEFAKSFERERDMSLFNKVKKKLSKGELNYLAREYQNCYLKKVEMKMYDKKNHIWLYGDFVMSTTEHLTVTSSAIKLSECDIYRYCWFNPYIFKDNIIKSLEILEYANIYRHNESNDYKSHKINLKPDELGIFLHYFGKTMKGK